MLRLCPSEIDRDRFALKPSRDVHERTAGCGLRVYEVRVRFVLKQDVVVLRNDPEDRKSQFLRGPFRRGRKIFFHKVQPDAVQDHGHGAHPLRDLRKEV